MRPVLSQIHSQSTPRPPIKNNLNEQLKIYYAYRDEQIHRTTIDKSFRSQHSFREIPSKPPKLRHCHSTSSSISLSQTPSEFTPPISSSSIRHNEPIDSPPPPPPPQSTSTSTSMSRDLSSLQRSTSFTSNRTSSSSSSTSVSMTIAKTKIVEKVQPANSCPLCHTVFDQSGIHRPVNDACGHTTCFQCFKTTMFQATGCSLCQQEKEQKQSTFRSPLKRSSFSSSNETKTFNNENHFEDAFFDDWSLNQSSNSSSYLQSKTSVDIRSTNRTYHDDDDDDQLDFEPDENLLPIDDDEGESDKVTWISNDVHDDGPEYRDREFPYTKRMFERFHALFGLRKFRSNQQEAVSCAVERKYHVFVLMPTGGGKSLCYQLPAVLDHGVTFVVSPLRSLILDQTQKLSSLGIPCAAMTSDRTPAEVSQIYAQCYSPEPKLKLVYITPEKIGQSDQLNKLFSHLYAKNNLARFVIDEAHCISDWGHDFRPDYVKIGALRDRYPLVPFTLLTATATPRVQRDMLHQMKIERHLSKLFIQSFNRSNLVYRCLLKGKTDGALARTAQLCLSEQFVGLCGIVYCFSRAECERSAAYLSQRGVTAQAYHAGLNDQDRADVQTQWANDEYQVICATIAFGMGIDKPNVRFVIHLSMPKSIEGYYQESGRAGRDGEQAYCYLFYSYQDLVKTKRLIMTEQSTNDSREARKVRLDNLHRVYAYCLNNVDCRRTLLLEYFGEQYLSSQCKRHVQTRCDNCCSVAQTKLVDFTTLSKQICALVDHLTKNSKTTTINQIVDILKGSKQRAIKDAGHNTLEQYNIADEIPRIDIERLLSKLMLEGYLHQDISINDTYGTATAYVRLGSNTTFSPPITLSVCTKAENTNISSTTSTNSTRHRLVDACLIKLKEQLKAISAEHNIKYSTILSEKALKQMAMVMPRTKEEMLRKTIEMTMIKYEMYQLESLLQITCQFRTKLGDEKIDDTTNSNNLKRKRDGTSSSTSIYFQDKTNMHTKKKK